MISFLIESFPYLIDQNFSRKRAFITLLNLNSFRKFDFSKFKSKKIFQIIRSSPHTRFSILIVDYKSLIQKEQWQEFQVLRLCERRQGVTDEGVRLEGRKATNIHGAEFQSSFRSSSCEDIRKTWRPHCLGLIKATIESRSWIRYGRVQRVNFISVARINNVECCVTARQIDEQTFRVSYLCAKTRWNPFFIVPNEPCQEQVNSER